VRVVVRDVVGLDEVEALLEVHACAERFLSRLSQLSASAQHPLPISISSDLHP
jgi:hypothetical protein